MDLDSIPDWIPAVLITFLGSGSITAVIVAILQRRKTGAEVMKARAEAADVISNSAITLLAPLREEMSRLRADMDTMRAELKVVQDELGREKRLVHSLASFCRALIDSHRKHASNVPLPDIPEALRDIL